jgi:hypothetical protein
MRCKTLLLCLGLAAALCSGHILAQPSELQYDEENDEIRSAGPKTCLDGEQMKAFLAAYKYFQNQKLQAPAQKRLENYTVGFSRDKVGILVYFTPKPIPNDPDISAANSNGIPLLFIVEPKKYHVLGYAIRS